jgi:outer membrane protein assembly factor BamB
LFVSIFVFVLGTGYASADDRTGAYSPLRTGWDANEPGLAPAQVSADGFGRLFTTQLTGQVYAQPIVVGGVVIAVTEDNHAYGLDAVTGAKKWEFFAGAAWPAATVGCADLKPNIGMTATPVYDPVTGAVYLTSKVNDGPDAQHPHWYMHALDAKTGVERPGFPTTISGTPTNNPGVPFNPMTAMQRPGLLLLDGVVYAGFASHCDYTPYVGYIVGVNSTTGKQTTIWSTEAGKSDEAGIWQSGSGLVSDGPGRIIVATGNGIAPPPGPGDTPPATLGESVVRLAVTADGSLAAQSFFSPHDNTKLNQDDTDLGSGGPMAIPAEFGTPAHPRMVVQVGKDGRVYLLDADHLGGAAQGPNATDDVLGVSGPFNGVWGRPGFWGGGGGYVYVTENAGPLRAFKFSTGGATPSLTPVGMTADNFGYASGSPVITSTGSTSGSALVWVVYSTGSAGDGAQLRAYDAVPVNGVLTLRRSLPIGTSVKFSVPGTDGGRLYVGDRNGNLIGFGRPTTSPLDMKSYDFGSSPVGVTANRTVTATATRPVTVSGVSTVAPFDATMASSVTLATGDTLSVPVSYTPSTWGSATASLTFHTDAGDTALDLHGLGTQPGLGASPSTLDFGQVRTGAAKELGVNIVNTGTTPETITGVTLSTGPFSASNVPADGTVLQPGTSVPIPVTYTPVTGSDAGTAETGFLSVASDQGTVGVQLAGVAVTGTPQMTLDPPSVDFGTVAVGQSVTKTFTVSNTGTVNLVITKAKDPVGAFHTEEPLSEGLQLPPGSAYTQKVTFTPTDVYPASSQYELTSNDGTGPRFVTVTGNVDPISDYYDQLGGSRNSGLSDPVSPEYDIAGGGKGRDYRNGAIYWSAATGPHAVRGAFDTKYREFGGPTGSFGYPTTDDTPVAGGGFTHFQLVDASIYWSPNTGAHAIYGAIAQKYAELGWETSVLGFPTTDESPAVGGRYNHFAGENGSIYWSPNTGAHAIYGVIAQKYAELGWETSVLGFPTTDESPAVGGRYNHFAGQNGSIYWSPNTGAHAIYGAIAQKWASLGWERSAQGFPTTDEYGVTGGRRNDFQHGTITFFFSNGSTQVVYW